MSGKTITIPYDEYLHMTYLKHCLKVISKIKKYNNKKANEFIEQLDFETYFNNGVNYINYIKQFNLIKHKHKKNILN